MGPDATLHRLAAMLLAILWLGGCAGGSEGGLGLPGGAASEGEVCGGIAGVACAEGLWCDPEPGACDRADVQGTCRVVPEVCTFDYRPACGCDHKTYGNDCARRAARAPLAHEGVCGVDAPPRG